MGAWNIGLFECSQNPSAFFIACCVPGGSCCIQMVNARISTRDGSAWKIVCILDCCLPVLGCAINRYYLRKALGIIDSVLFDCVFWLYCPSCAATQEYIETMDRMSNGNKGAKFWSSMRNI